MVFKLSKDLVFTREVLEAACDNIVDEIVDYIIEGICFEIHRAVKLDYYPAQEYAVNQLQFELFQGVEHPGEKRDIYFNDRSKKAVMTTCQFCGQKKAAEALMRHLKHCRARSDDQPIWGEREVDKKEKTKENSIENATIQNVTTENRIVGNDSDDNSISGDNYISDTFDHMKLTAIFDAQMKIT